MNRYVLSGWLGTVCLGAAGLAIAVPIVAWPGWLSLLFVVIALGSFVGVLATGPIQPDKWRLRTHIAAALRPIRARRQQTHARPASAITDSWQFTTDGMMHPQLARIGQDIFSHQAYSRPADSTPPCVRVKALVACSQLEDGSNWQELRGRFLALVTHEWLMTLIFNLTVIGDDAIWQPRATGRRSWLEADLTGQDTTKVPAASAKLLLPEAGPGLFGTDRRCAEFTAHIDLVRGQELLITIGEGQESKPVIEGLPSWRKQISKALTMPGDLDGFLRHDLGLATSGDPPAQFGILLRAVKSITEIVRPGSVRALTAAPHYVVNEYIGFAIADAAGKSADGVASEIMLDLSQRVLHLDGLQEEMSGLTSEDDLELLRKLAVEGHMMRSRVPPADKRGLFDIPPSDLLTRFESWKAEVAAALRSRPELLAQFQGEPVRSFGIWVNRASEPHWREIEYRTDMLTLIVKALEGRT